MPPTSSRRRTRAKWDRLRGVSTPGGVIAAVAMDQRKSLRKALAAAGGQPVEDSQLIEFKTAVTEVLSPHASAILLDPEYGLEAAKARSAGCGLLMTYESDGYENPRPHRMLELMPHASVARLEESGAAGIKILLSWADDGDRQANDAKRATIERVGAECEGVGIPFFLEPVAYDPGGLDPRSPEFARRKPEAVVRIMEEFSKPVYRVDVLKVEFPVNPRFVEGSAVDCGTRAYSMDEALDWYRKADAAAQVPYIYLSAGVGHAEFRESLGLAAQSGSRFSGVLCGRANWQDGIPQYARGGREALVRWLSTEGVANMQRVNECLRAATPWTEWFEQAQ